MIKKLCEERNKKINTKYKRWAECLTSDVFVGSAAARPMGRGSDDSDEAWANHSRQPLY